MEPKIRSSFIPKAPLETKAEKRRKQIGFNAVTYTSIVVFLAAIFSSVALFVYKDIVMQDIQTKANELSVLKNSLDIDKIDKYKKLGDRLAISNQVLNQHRGTQFFFDFIESSILKNVQLNELSYTYDPTNESINIIFSGEAAGFNSLLLQGDVFESNPSILVSSVEYGGLSESGTVQFSGKATIDPSVIKYPVVENETFEEEEEFIGDNTATTTI